MIKQHTGHHAREVHRLDTVTLRDRKLRSIRRRRRRVVAAGVRVDYSVRRAVWRLQLASLYRTVIVLPQIGSVVALARPI